MRLPDEILVIRNIPTLLTEILFLENVRVILVKLNHVGPFRKLMGTVTKEVSGEAQFVFIQGHALHTPPPRYKTQELIGRPKFQCERSQRIPVYDPRKPHCFADFQPRFEVCRNVTVVTV